MNIIKIKTTDSSNQLLKELLKIYVLKEWTIITAESQTLGRGQIGNSWESQANKNITCSILLYPKFLQIKQCFLLSKVIAIGIKEALNVYIKQGVTIKWPNDIYFKNKKIAGILIENEVICGKIIHSIIGIGVNVNQQTFESNAPNPVSLKQIIGFKVNTDILLKQIIERVAHWYKKLKFCQNELISRVYNDSLFCKDEFHLYRDTNGFFKAAIQSVSAEGLIHLKTDKKENRLYYSKDISLVKNFIQKIND
ncbi:MAG: biotin--[acetyl-CoA-carboxylase] ligase [Bacteroidales bacterium OttesenSCG-928-I14]|jgi:BirA family biotin operon repressor/biotin-[acetyl-CoA-carboxylase] ligase|nr:biotin--[acetyl-CoA-carboxylase] ligase [Bacteroidales bacterium OttesenSCG-928-I14]